jgi:hypothetical protein
MQGVSSLSVGVIWDEIPFETPVIPAKAGIQSVDKYSRRLAEWIPAFAGMTATSTATSPKRHDYPTFWSRMG